MIPEQTNQCQGDIAVIGMAGRFPGAGSIDEFWENIRQGRETISRFSHDELLAEGISANLLRNKRYVKAKGVIEGIDLFDADFFGYPPREAEKMDPQIRLLHHVSWEALEHAGYDPLQFSGLIGAFMGANENQTWLRYLEKENGHISESVDTFLVNYRDYVSTRIAYKLNLRGPSFTLLSACSTSLVAVHLACQSLLQNECQMALAGGVSITLPGKSGYLYQEGLMVSRDGRCRTFDARADGTVFGDGAGVVVLKRLERAKKERDTILAVIKGSAINNDGDRKAGFTAPSIQGQEAVIRAAQKAARVSPGTIDYVEAHGTATRLGDPIEVKALTRAFENVNGHRCALGSVKTNIGHVNIAAGVASLIKTVMMLRQKEIPATLNFRKPNPEIDWKKTPFEITTRRREWKRNGSPRRAGVSAFGFGGTNAHLVLEEAPESAGEVSNRPAQLLPLSARTESSLERMKTELSGFMKRHPRLNRADAAFTLAAGRRAFARRTWAVAHDSGKIEFAPAGRRPSSDASFDSAAFLFPGQGAQYPGMGRALYDIEPVYRETIDACADILKPLIGSDIRELLHGSPDDEAAAQTLKQTTFAQPAIFTVSYALARLWMSWGVVPAALLGHSIGEYVAACVAGVFSLEDALRLVARRGALMQSLPPGAMLALPLGFEEVASCLPDDLDVAAANSPGLTVVAGPEESVGRFHAEWTARGYEGRFLHTSHAFHSKMMDPILADFEEELGRVPMKSPTLPVISTVTGKAVSGHEMSRPGYWVKNVRQAVRFSDAVKSLLQSNHALLECGPGRTLGALTRMHEDALTGRPVLSSLPGAHESASSWPFLLNSLGGLWAGGYPVVWARFYGRETRRRVALPTYSFEPQRFPASPHQARPPSRWEQLHKEPNMDRWFSVPVWNRSAQPANPAPLEKEEVCLLFGDAGGETADLAGALQALGVTVILVVAGNEFAENSGGFTLHPEHRCDYDALFEQLTQRNALPSRIVHCWTAGLAPLADLDASLNRSQFLGFYSLLFLAQVMSQHNITDDVAITVISDGWHDVLGGEPLRPEKSTVLGAVKVIPQEHPNVFCRAVDLPLNEKLQNVTAHLVREIMSQDVEPMTALRNGYRWVQRFDAVEMKPVRRVPVLKKQGVYLVTGGLGGIGMVLADFLAREYQARLVLVSRTPLPERSQWPRLVRSRKTDSSLREKIRAIRRMEKAGGRVMPLAADVSDESDMRRVLQEVESVWGAVNGVIHAAGLSGEGILQLKRPESANKILAPKVKGTLVLDRIFKEKELDLFMLCSSIASVLGGIGLGDYCAANVFLDAFAAQWHPRRRGAVTAVNWDMWGEVGMGLTTQMPDELQDWLEKELRDGIMSDEGVDAFRRILARDGAPQIIVSTRDLDVRVDLWIKREILKEKERILEENAARPRYQRPALTTGFQEPETDTEKTVAEIWAMLFGIETIGRDDNFYELGGHSLLATTLVTRLKKALDASLSIRDVMDHPTVRDLARKIESN